MATQMENSPVCGAAGDPCIAETTKPVHIDKIADNEVTEKIPIVEPNIVIPEVPLSEKENTPEIKEKSVISETALNDKVPIAKPSEVPAPVIEPNVIEDAKLRKLQQEVEKRTNERDDFARKLAETEKKLAALEASYETVISGKDSKASLRRELKELKCTLAQSQTKLNERGRLMVVQESQISALTKQVSSLKEVVVITKNLLEIRNMELKHLQDDVDGMESRISEERDRHNAMLRKMEAAVRLNADLKTEYETQLQLFHDLRGKYEEKAALLASENGNEGCGNNVVEEPISLPPGSIQQNQ